MRKQRPHQMAGCDICDGYQPFTCLICSRAPGSRARRNLLARLRLPRDTSAGCGERGKGAEEAEHQRDQERGASSAGRMCRHKAKGTSMTRMTTGARRATRGHAEQHCRKPDEQVLERVGGDQRPRARTQGLQHKAS